MCEMDAIALIGVKASVPSTKGKDESILGTDGSRSSPLNGIYSFSCRR